MRFGGEGEVPGGDRMGPPINRACEGYARSCRPWWIADRIGKCETGDLDDGRDLEQMKRRRHLRTGCFTGSLDQY